ncbi:MAG: flavin reductase family protein [Burkholderiaceae bacterium]
MTAHSPDFDQSYFRSALGRFATGVTIITTETAEGDPWGLTISSFNAVSLEPPMVLWSLSHSASALPHFLQAKRYVIHVLSASQLPLARRFAYGRQEERFLNVALKPSPHGVPMLADPDTAAWFECHNTAHHPAGDHIIFVGQVERCNRRYGQPLVYHAGDFDLTPSIEPLPDR